LLDWPGTLKHDDFEIRQELEQPDTRWRGLENLGVSWGAVDEPRVGVPECEVRWQQPGPLHEPELGLGSLVVVIDRQHPGARSVEGAHAGSRRIVNIRASIPPCSGATYGSHISARE